MTHYLSVVLRALSAELDEDTVSGLPSMATEVVAAAERTEGVRLGKLLAALEPDQRTVGEALAEILRAVADPGGHSPLR